LRPLEGLLGGKTLIIVPHGKIAFLPFESLISGAGGEKKYLLEKYRIKYIQSASVLGMLRTLRKQEETGKSFLGFGDPVYDYENYRQGKLEVGEEGHLEIGDSGLLTKRGYSRAGGRLSRLIGSGTEVKEIGNIFQQNMFPSKTLLRTDAREELAKARDIQGYGYIHFSTHGILGPKFQAIALAQMPQSDEDGFLTLGEIMNNRFNAELIVLSACETGLGHIYRGEGVTGLTRAVMYAGTPAAIVSLWSVSDDGTTELMILFYHNLIQKGMGKEESLRQAKIDMLKGNLGKRGFREATSLRSARILERRQGRDFGHPFFWAPFVMYGE
jgi:CHAT domain-containing protein